MLVEKDKKIKPPQINLNSLFTEKDIDPLSSVPSLIILHGLIFLDHGGLYIYKCKEILTEK